MARLTLSFRERTLKLIPLDGERFSIGRDPTCDIHIDSLALQPQHALVEKTAGGWLIRDLESPDGTFLNEVRISEQPLQDRDVIRVGKHELTFHQDLDEPAMIGVGKPPCAKSAWLQILNGQNVGKAMSLNRSLTNLGRTGVQTAVIAKRNDGFFLSHLEGEHSPQVNGESIGNRSRELRDGDIIQMGNIKMKFHLQ